MAHQSSLKAPAFSLRTALLAGLTAGTLDLLGALVVYVVLMGKLTTTVLLQGIASGLFGKDAFRGGVPMALAGVLLHYLIALLFAAFYVWLYPRIALLRRNRFLSGLLYGAAVWLVMNFAVLPLSQANNAPLRWDSVMIGLLLVLLFIGMPIARITASYYERIASLPQEFIVPGKQNR